MLCIRNPLNVKGSLYLGPFELVLDPPINQEIKF